MQSKQLRLAIRATATAAVFGMAMPASAIDISTGDWKADLYGFARLAAAYDIDEDISMGGRGGSFGAISTDGTDTGEGHFGMDANTSRLGVSVTSPEGVKGVVEFDFDNGVTSTGLEPRLRRGFLEYNGILIGQEWSNFNSFVANPSILDFDSLPGRAGLQNRQAQIRYTMGNLSFSVEDDTSQGTDNIAGTGGDKTALPAFTARLEDSAGGFSYSAAALVKQIGYDDGTDDDNALGFATFLAGKLAVTDMFSIMGSVSFADGASNYIYRSGENFGGFEGYRDGDDVETIETYGANIGAGLNLGGGRSVNIGYGTTMKDLDDAVDDGVAGAATTAESNSTIAVNYQWKPIEKVTMGVEFARLSTENQNNDDGDASRVMFVGQYNF